MELNRLIFQRIFTNTFAHDRFSIIEFDHDGLSMSKFYVRWIQMNIEIEDVPAGDLRLKLLLTNAINTREQVFLNVKHLLLL